MRILPHRGDGVHRAAHGACAGRARPLRLLPCPTRLRAPAAPAGSGAERASLGGPHRRRLARPQAARVRGAREPRGDHTRGPGRRADVRARPCGRPSRSPRLLPRVRSRARGSGQRARSLPRRAEPCPAGKGEGEAVVRSFPIPWTILRPALVYGPGADARVDAAADARFAAPAGAGLRRRHADLPIWVEDLAAAVAACLEAAGDGRGRSTPAAGDGDGQRAGCGDRARAGSRTGRSGCRRTPRARPRGSRPGSPGVPSRRGRRPAGRTMSPTRPRW
jgi:hypothetical protein